MIYYLRSLMCNLETEQESYQNFVDLGNDDEENRYVYHCQLGKTFVMTQIKGY